MNPPEPPARPDPGLHHRLRQVWNECRTALHALVHCQGEPASHVHTLRKRGKRLRGGLDLASAPRHVKDDIRDLGRILGPTRDAAVRAATLRSLRESPEECFADDSALPVAVALLAEEAAVAEGTPPAPVLTFVDDRLTAVGQWLDQAGPAAAEPVSRLRRMATRLDNALERLGRKKAGGRCFHEARKAAKRLHGALWFLLPEPGKEAAKYLKHLDALGDELGSMQDLEVLGTWLDRGGLTPARLPGLHRAVARRRKRLISRVKRHAAAFNTLALPLPASAPPHSRTD